MCRPKGHKKWDVETRNLLEGIQLEHLVMGDDLDLLEKLLNQEIDRRTNPSDALQNALEITQRLKTVTGARAV